MSKASRVGGDGGGLWQQPALMNLLADGLIVASVASLVWAGLLALQRLPVFPLREVVLTAAPRHVSVEQIAHAARTSIVGNFFTVDLAAARSTFERLPWVRNATVRRLWPQGLVLALEEHEAVTQWRQSNGARGLVNRQGEVFVAELPDATAELPLLSGPEGSAAELLARHAEFSAALAPLGRNIATLTLSPRRAWQLELDDGTSIVLGRDQERLPLREKLTRFAAHYAGVRQHLANIRSADLRYPNGFIVAGGALSRPASSLRPGQSS